MKQPLTPQGVSDKLSEIYAMTTVDRMAEAAAIETDFRTWVSDNFTLTTAQGTYLTGMSNTAVSHFAANSGLCFRNKLEIALIAPTPPDGSTKWIKMTNNILISTNASGGFEATGTLTFAMEYR